MKKTDDFDNIIKNKLERLDTPPKTEHWDLFAQRLDEAIVEEEQGHPVADAKPVDEAVFEKLHKLQVPYNPANWLKMEALLDEAFVIPSRILQYKLAELSILLLVFYFIGQSIPAPESPGKIPYEKSQQIIASKTPDEAPAPASKPGPANAMAPATHKQVANGKATTTTTANSTATNATANTLDYTQLATASEEASTSKRKRFVPLTPIAAVDVYAKSTQAAKTLPISARDILPDAENAIQTLEAIPTLDAASLPEVLAALPDDIQAVPSKQKGVVRIGMYGSGEFNHIMVPTNQEKAKTDYDELNRFAIGYGSGLSVGLDMGRWELETGAMYAARRYPVGLVFLGGQFEEGYYANRLSAGELNMLSLPLHFRYNFVYKNKWRVYALAGGSLHLAFQAAYSAVEAPDFAGPPNPVAPPQSPQEGETSITELKQESVGLFEGGAFNDNAYITGNIGLGVERYISEHWSIYAQPTYQHSLHYFREGLGPNKDRINALSFILGAKIRL
jgi:hypothetical protein